MEPIETGDHPVLQQAKVLKNKTKNKEMLNKIVIKSKIRFQLLRGWFLLLRASEQKSKDFALRLTMMTRRIKLPKSRSCHQSLKCFGEIMLLDTTFG